MNEIIKFELKKICDIKKSCELLVGEITEEKVKPIQALHEQILKNKNNYIVVNDEVEMKDNVRKKIDLLENEGIMNFTYLSIMQVQPLFDKFSAVVLLNKVVMIKDIILTLFIALSSIMMFVSFNIFKNHQVSN